MSNPKLRKVSERTSKTYQKVKRKVRRTEADLNVQLKNTFFLHVFTSAREKKKHFFRMTREKKKASGDIHEKRVSQCMCLCQC